MNISELSVRRPVTITMLFILVFVVSAIFVPRLGVGLYPSVTMPRLTVFTSYPNVGPDEIEANVTAVLENRLARIRGLTSISSQSSTGSSRITLSFGYDVNLDEASAEINEVLAQAVRALPADCGVPVLRRFDMSAMPIMRLNVKGNLPLDQLRSIAEETVQPLLERVEGVASADVAGGAARFVRVDVSANRLEAFGLSLSSIAQSLSARNVRLAGGTLSGEQLDYQIRTNEVYRSLEEVRATVIAAPSSATVLRLGDIADVYEDFDYSGSRIWIDGVPGLYVSVTNETGTNSASVARGVRAALDGINESLPAGVEVVVVSDDTTLVNSTLNQVYTSAVWGAVLAMLVIFIFLRSVKGTVIIGLSMPISIIVTLLVMSLMNLTINIMTMAGLILGIGMIVDSSIVVLENIHLYRERGDRPAVAAILGSREMLNAIVASTATTLCVFIPMIIYKAELEMMGQMFQDLVITVVISLSVSLVVAVTLVPALCGSILRLDTRVQKPLRFPVLARFDAGVEGFLRALENGYVRALRFVLANRFLVLTLVSLLLVLSLLRFGSLGMNLAPTSTTDDRITVSLSMPAGTNAAVTEDLLFRMQQIIQTEVSGYTSLLLNAGQGTSGSIQINLPPPDKQTLTPADIRTILTPHLSSFPGANFSFSSGRSWGGSSPVNIALYSRNSDELAEAADRIVEILKEQVPQLTNVSTDQSSGNPEYLVKVDTDRAASLGVSVQAVASQLRTMLNGVTATTFLYGANEIQVRVRLRDSDLDSLSDLLRITVPGRTGRVSLDNLVTLESGYAPRSISREDGLRLSRVTAQLVSGAAITDVQPLVDAALAQYLVLPESVTMAGSGESRDIQRFGGSLILVLLVAVFLVFLVMAAQFESLVDPFIIFFSIPLLVIGVVWIYVIMKMPFTLYGGIGAVALVGVIVNNGIVLVDAMNRLMDKKTPVMEACLSAGRNRLRPILMTTLTTVTGMIPMSFFPGPGGEMMQPVGLTIVGGLVSGAVLTLFVTPVMYSLFNKRREQRFANPDALMNQLAEYDTVHSTN